jgi:hypothetical protein
MNEPLETESKVDLVLYVLKRGNSYLGRSGIIVHELKSAKTFSGLGPAKVSRNTWERRMGQTLGIFELCVTEGQEVIE